MNEFEQNILVISNNICKNIASLPDNERGFVSQNILNNLRNLIEAIDQRIYSDVASIELNNYHDIEKSIKYVASRGNLRFLSKFHECLQASVSHYTPDEDNSVRLMLKYYEWMLRIRDYCKKAYNLEILTNLEESLKPAVQITFLLHWINAEHYHAKGKKDAILYDILSCGCGIAL